MKDGDILTEKPVKIHFLCNPAQYDDLPSGQRSLNQGMDSSEYVVQKNSRKNTRALTSGIESYRDYARALFKSYWTEEEGGVVRKYALPLWACFSTEDIHANRKINVQKFKIYSQKPSFGYYECLEGNGFFSYWLKWLLVLQEGQKRLLEIEVVRKAIIKALGTEGCGIIQDIHIRYNQGKVYYLFIDGREVDAGLLSDGYRRLVNIVTDLAFRCVLLNGSIYGVDAADQTRGTVLIDEIDLHLHPSLQAKVLKGLHHAFPKIQFIATTHAPMVMTSVENNEENVVYKLSYEKGEYKKRVVNTYGMDVSTITDVVLNLIPRNVEIDKQLDELFRLIDEGEVEKARCLLTDLQGRFGGNIPELAQAEAMVDFSIVTDNVADK